ncbi:MAG TPA: BON domain-containing protein [Gemmataceae bacterium]|nr:BON domain-containing protein [Gemmataceae bacterium]
MTRRSRILAAAVLGLSLAPPLASRAADPATAAGGLPPLAAATKIAAPVQQTGLSAEQAPAAKAVGNHEVAAAVADSLRQAGKVGQIRHYNIDVVVKDGTTQLSGTVASDAQRAEVLKLVKAVPGVAQVVDKMTLLAPNPIAQVQATAPAAPAQPPAPVLPPQFAAEPPRELVPGPNAPAGVIPEPLPTFAGPVPSPYDLNPPQMPPYAWPTYAPYNNFSRVAYPLNYPYQSWPYIGPCYPFPKIPPGWRSVKLEWEDGHWWYSRVATQNGYWRLRFW